MKTLLRSMLLLILSVAALQSNASHILGGEITVSQGTSSGVTVGMNLFRDCSGIPAANPEVVTVTNGCGANFTVQMNLISETEITSACAGTLTYCQGGTDQGFSKVYYEGSFIPTTSCTDWNFVYTSCCHSASISNLNNASNYGYNISAFEQTIPVAAVQSFLFSVSPQIVAPVNQQTQISFARPFSSQSVNQFVYTLIDVEDDLGASIPYNTGFTAQSPFGTGSITSFDQNTGIMNVTPVNVGSYSIRVLEEESSNGVVIHSYEKEVTIFVVPSTNQNPSIAGLSSNNFYPVCIGDTLTIALISSDADIADSTYIEIDYQSFGSLGLPNASLNLNAAQNASGVFQFIPDSASIALNPITLYFRVRDNACPYNGSQYYAVQIHVSGCNSDVWPGDVNTDLQCNLFDVLPIGVGYGSSGPVRSGASTNWTAQPASDWGQTFLYGSDYKHADTNGDGTIDDADTLAVAQNFGLTHPLRLSNPSSNSTAAVLPIEIGTPLDSAYSGDTVNFAISIGTNSNPVNAIYGIAFQISFDPTLIDPLLSSYNFTNSFLGTIPSDLLTMVVPDLANGIINCVAVRKNQINVAGQGTIGVFSIVISDNVAARSLMNVRLQNVRAITVDEDIIQLNSVNDSIILNVDPNGWQHLSNDVISVYPNPSNGAFYLQALKGEIQKIVVNDITGREVKVVTSSANGLWQMNISEKGIYTITVTTSKGLVISKQIIMH